MKVFVTLEYRGERVTVEEDWPSREGETAFDAQDSFEWYWSDGNMACDCNRSRVARAAGANWPELDCSSEQIEVVGMRFEE